MVRYLDEHEKEQCRSLWEEAFAEDSPAFVKYYFEEKTKDNRVLVRQEGGIIQSMLHLNPYCLAVKDGTWQADYIVGVATRADCRRRGYMRDLLAEMFVDLWQQKKPFVFLMPAAKEIYEPFDFVYIYDQPLWQLKAGINLARKQILSDAGIADHEQRDAAADWMMRWLQDHYQVYAIRDKEYTERLGRELASERGQMELLYDRNNIVGIYAEWGIKVREQRLLYAEDSYVSEVERKPAIMARIVNLNAVLSQICLKPSYVKRELQIVLRLTDAWIPENDGLWIWYLTKAWSWAEPAETGELKAAELGSNALEAADQPPLLELSAGELTSWLFGYSIPEAARIYQDAVAPLQNIFLDEAV